MVTVNTVTETVTWTIMVVVIVTKITMAAVMVAKITMVIKTSTGQAMVTHVIGISIVVGLMAEILTVTPTRVFQRGKSTGSPNTIMVSDPSAT